MSDTKQAARRAESSTLVKRLGRAGLASRGIVWLVIGLLTLQIALGGRAQADKNGALQTIAGQPFGELLLAVLAVGFLAYAVWQGLEAAAGLRDEADDKKRAAKRFGALCRAVVYAALAFSTVRFLVNGQSGGDKTQPLTARLMQHAGGRTLVFLVGAGLIIGGLCVVGFAVKQKFEDKVKQYEMPDSMRPLAKVIGTAGFIGHGLVFVLIGSFIVKAAVEFDPNQAKGLDAALKALAQEAYGKALLVLAALGLLAFALWSCIEARYRKL
jgi:hypothetical protein